MNRKFLNQSNAISGENSVLVFKPLGKLGHAFRWQIVFSILGRVGGMGGHREFLIGEHAWGEEGE